MNNSSKESNKNIIHARQQFRSAIVFLGFEEELIESMMKWQIRIEQYGSTQTARNLCTDKVIDRQ